MKKVLALPVYLFVGLVAGVYGGLVAAWEDWSAL